MKKEPVDCSIDEFNEVLDEFKHLKNLNLKRVSACAVFTTPSGQEFWTSLTGNTANIVHPNIIAKNLNKNVSFPKLSENEELRQLYGYKIKTLADNAHKFRVDWDLPDPGNFSFINPDYSHTDLICWSYDVNSAYSRAMLMPMPDTRVPSRSGYINDGEIGFYLNGGATTEKGQFSNYIFPLIESPYKKYVDYFYSLKKSAKDKRERSKYKNYLNVATGLLHRYDIFHRLATLYYSREHVRKYIDDNTVYSNTDCIVSLVPRPDIPLGNDIGDFKLEHNGEPFKFLDTGIYQWGDEAHYVGIPVEAKIDIYSPKGWQDKLPYKIDFENKRIVKNA